MTHQQYMDNLRWELQALIQHNLEQAQVLFKVYQMARDGSLDDLQVRDEVIEIIGDFLGPEADDEVL